MDVKLISISTGIKNDAIGKYIRHTPSNVIINVNSIEYKFNHNGKQVGHYSNTKDQRGYWMVSADSMKELKKILNSDA